MVQNNKILTVSYGTFSCTLEGFDDSFDTMKAIAEYFRDLASDDRYFGAEPPQPDADMLARIAQREVTRQVEARTSETGIHLRAAERPTVAIPVEAQEQNTAEAEAAVQGRAIAKTEPTDRIEEKVEPKAEPVIEAKPEIKAEPVAEAKPEVKAEPVAEAKPEVKAEPVAETKPEIKAEPVAEAKPEIKAEPVAEAKPEVTAEPVVEAEIGDESVPAADSIAAKLQRIRAVVAQAPLSEEFSEDQHADSFIKDAAENISAALRIADDAEPGAEDDTQDQEAIAKALEQIDQRQAAAEIAEPEPEPEVADNSEATPAKTDDSLFEGIESSTTAAATDAESAPKEVEPNILVEGDPRSAKPDAKAKKPKERLPLRARIARVKRADLDRALASGALEAIAEPEVAPEVKSEAKSEAEPEVVLATSDQAPAAKPETSLSDADEADLLRELAAVEAELLGTDDDALAEIAALAEIEAEIGAETVAQIEPEAEAAKTSVKDPTDEDAAQQLSATELPDGDVSRLMAAADKKLEDPESTDSRETYSQLRAAVAAAKAENAIGGSGDTDDEAYREDLANVVRPRRPAPKSSSVQRRPTPVSRPAPLKLVAEQRIDEIPAKSRGPVRPRRIATAQVDEAEFSNQGGEGGFIAYAADSGATELHELLEAAASYMSFVEGRDQFSRPQLMNKVKQLDSAEFNREDGLRSFGQLLRDGKIERTANGRFTASGHIGFRPNARAAG